MGKSIQGKRTVAGSALKVLNITDIFFDDKYQREVVPSVVKKIIGEFNQEAFGVPVVGNREDGTYWCVDGKQRLTALAKMERKQARVEVFASQGPEHEAEVFRLINRNRKPLTPAQIFTALLVAGDEEAWEIKRIVEAAGFKISKSGGKSSESTPENQSKTVAAVGAIQKVWKYSGKGSGVKFVFDTLAGCWPGVPDRVKDSIIIGLGRFYNRMEGNVDIERLQKRLNTTTPQKLMFSATLGSGDRAGVMADVIEKMYRKKDGKKPS